MSPPPDEIHLLGVGCRVTVPPRYIQTSLIPLPNIACFSKVSIPADTPVLLDVWVSPDLQLTGATQSRELEKLAIKTIQDWKHEGARIEQIDTRTLPDLAGRVQLETYVRFVTNEPVHAVGNWFIDTDGRVFRINIAAPRYLEKGQLAADVQSILASWQRLEGLPKLKAKTKKWWQLW